MAAPADDDKLISGAFLSRSWCLDVTLALCYTAVKSPGKVDWVVTEQTGGGGGIKTDTPPPSAHTVTPNTIKAFHSPHVVFH